MHRIIPVFAVCILFATACGGATPSGTESAPPSSGDSAPATTVSECARPIDTPSAVWPRIEAARAMSEAQLVSECGLGFVSALSEWRSPPLDLLRPIVRDAAADNAALETWAAEQARAGNPAGAYVTAASILGAWRLGDDAAPLLERAAAWREAAAGIAAIEAVTEETETAAGLLASLERLHELRCLLEVNPLGFAERCTPVHPPREDIDLTWHEERQDGIFLDVRMTRCAGSRSCKKLKPLAAEFSAKYDAARTGAEALGSPVFQELIFENLKLPAFSPKGN